MLQAILDHLWTLETSRPDLKKWNSTFSSQRKKKRLFESERKVSVGNPISLTKPGEGGRVEGSRAKISRPVTVPGLKPEMELTM